MGVACVKLEGRMKRPEYVAVVTGIYARAIKEDREPTAEELEQLRAAFSRQGFTQGYYLDRQGPDMFGVREETKEPKELFAAARNTYQSEMCIRDRVSPTSTDRYCSSVQRNQEYLYFPLSVGPS